MNDQCFELLDNFITGVVIHDANTEILYANHSALTLLGLSMNQIYAKEATDPHWSFIRDDGSPMPLEEFPVYQALSSGKAVQNITGGIIRPGNDCPTWVLCNATPIWDKNKNISQVVVNFTDITKQRQSEENLKNKLIFTENLINSMLDGFSVLDKDGVQTEVNTAFCQMTRFSREELVGLEPPYPYWPSEEYDRIQAAFQQMRAGHATHFELIFMRKNGERFPVIIAPSVIKDKNNNIISYTATVKDITEQNLLENNLKVALENAKQSAVIKSRFLDIAAHELRTPVSIFSLLLQLTIKKLKKGIPVELETLERLNSQVDRISQLVVELLDVSRLERGALVLKKKPTRISSLITQCIDDFKLREPSREFIFHQTNLPDEINIDALRIFQVISNLVDNAIKYTVGGLPVEVSMDVESDFIRVSIKDKGHGISTQQQEELFAPFSRGSGKQVEQSGGLGLGLFISREIIALHNGEIGVTSEIGIGSTFYFELPL